MNTFFCVNLQLLWAAKYASLYIPCSNFDFFLNFCDFSLDFVYFVPFFRFVFVNIDKPAVVTTERGYRCPSIPRLKLIIQVFKLWILQASHTRSVNSHTTYLLTRRIWIHLKIVQYRISLKYWKNIVKIVNDRENTWRLKLPKIAWMN